MADWEAPAKLNLDLRVGRVDASGMHPLRSLVQVIDWIDVLTVEEGDEDVLEVEGAELPEGGENLVWKAVEELAVPSRPPLLIHLRKRLPVASGLGGGSADAAATLRAVADLLRLPPDRPEEVAPAVGSDVPFFLVGGTAWMEGHGERLTPVEHLEGFALGVVVPPFELSTAEVYRRWDRLDGPMGEEVPVQFLPPALRRHGEMRNDLTPAAVDLCPELADWMKEVGETLERAVFMSGSGPACFAYFLDDDEAAAAVSEVAVQRAARAALPRREGVARRA